MVKLSFGGCQYSGFADCNRQGGVEYEKSDESTIVSMTMQVQPKAGYLNAVRVDTIVFGKSGG